MASRRRFRIGYALLEKKQKSFIQPSLLQRARAQGIDLLPVDPRIPLPQQGPFDAILHKLPGNPSWTQHLLDYSSAHPDLLVVDPPLAIHRLHNRISMLQAVAELQPPEHPLTVGVPKQCVFDGPSSLQAVARLRFPVIAKPLLVDGSAKSHAMTLVFNPQSLANLKPPLVLQEFINHGGVIFKVYVVGEFVECVRRISLPDVDEDKLKKASEAVSFCHISNTASSTSLDLPHTELPPGNFFSSIASGLRKALGLRLFNFDIIRDIKAGHHYYIIDINYFPGYAKMPAYEKVLTDFFLGLAEEKLASSKSCSC